MAKLRITQKKSRNNRPIDQKRTLNALGLHRIGSTVEHEDTPSIQGMVRKVSHLVVVENID